MISRDGYAKILDFGLAKLVAQRERALAADSAQKTLLRVETESGALMGTVNYMSPEQLLGQRVDHRCDVFSFAVVLCEMITGAAPFVHDNRIDTMHAILHRDPRLPDGNHPDVPTDLHRILIKGLAKNPKERYQTVVGACVGAPGTQARSRSGSRAVPLGAVRTRLVLKARPSCCRRERGINYDAELNEAQAERPS
jgi:serine/threonine protein kinase